jgi:hypothetical protein
MASQGDPRVLIVMNLVLSSVFAVVVLWGFDFLGLVPFTPLNAATLAVLLVGVTYLVTK